MESKKDKEYYYNVKDSANRMDEILNASNDDFADNKDRIPSRKDLTYKNGYYVDVIVLFIDIVDSSKLSERHKRPVLAKIYRCFLSECVAILDSYKTCKEININGDCVWGVFQTTDNKNIECVINAAAKLVSMINILNNKLKRNNFDEISVGIGIDIGVALMVKAGYTGSNLNEIIWMGDVVNSACHLANKAGRKLGWIYRKTILVSKKVYDKAFEDTQKLLSMCTIDGTIYYEGNFSWTNMDNWYKENCT